MANELLGKDILLFDNDIQFSSNQDFAVIKYEKNLIQAVYNRLQTYLGEYYIEEYGSELYKCIGKPANRLLKNRIKGYIFETLLQEPRIDSVREIEVEFKMVDRNRITAQINIKVNQIGTQNELNLIFPDFIIS
jgi:phage baseplate assembly protein W